MKTSEARLRANAAWRERHREDHLRRRRERHAERMADPDYVARRKALRDAGKEAKREYDREYRARTAEQQAAWTAEWIARNPEKRKAISRQYKAKRRSREEAGIASAVLAAWTAEQPKVCFYCDTGCDEGFHVDHFIPLSKGGAHVLTNLRIACASCNLKKNAKMPDEFMREVARSRVNAAMFAEAA